MRLAELSTVERRYLSSPLPPVDSWTPLLMARLCGVLEARMKQRVQIFRAAPEPLILASATERSAPEFQWDSNLDAMWLRARLGGSVHSNVRCTALSRNLQHSLQQVLAETWLSSTYNKVLPGMLRLRIEIHPAADLAQQATLTLYFPATSSQMDRWAQCMNAR